MDRFVLIESAQLIVNGFGLLYSFRSIRKAARKHYDLVIFEIGNGRRTAVIGQLVGESIRFFVHVCLLWAAAVSLFLIPSPPYGQMGSGLFAWLYVRNIFLLVTAVLCVGKTWWYQHIVSLLEAEGEARANAYTKSYSEATYASRRTETEGL